MGMLLRRKERIPEVLPKVNGKPVVKPPKTKSLTNENKVDISAQPKI
jgi:hypothetical protein